MFNKNKKGVMGMSILVSVIVAIFLTGIIVMAFQLTTTRIQANTVESTPSINVGYEMLGKVTNSTLKNFSVSTYQNVACSISEVTNQTSSQGIGAANYTVSNCAIQAVAGAAFQERNFTVNYSYYYTINGPAGQAMNETSAALAGSDDFYTIFLTIAGVIVLIFVIALIITTIRGGGLMDGKDGA